MDPHLQQAINDLQSMKNTKENSACWKCCKKYPCDWEPFNESVFRSITTHFKSSNILMFISTNSSCITSKNAFDTTVLKTLLNVLLDGKMASEDKEHTINLLSLHSQMYPSCCELLTDTFHNLILQPMEENQVDGTTIVQKILRDLENALLLNKKTMLNSWLSRKLRKKKKSDDFYTEEDLAPKRCKAMINEDPFKVMEVTENNLAFVFGALNFIVETVSHEFYSKCNSSDDENILRKTIAGSMFLNFNKFEVQLQEELIGRFIEIFKHCDDSNRRYLSQVIELIADTCLFADSRKLTVCGDIMCNKQYPLSQLFSQYFIQSVFKRTSPSESNVILKSIKPPWLRLNCALSALKRSGFPKGLPSFLEKLASDFEKCLNGDASSVISGKFQTFIEKRMNEDVSIILLNFLGTSSETYRLRELEKLYNINKNNNIIADSKINISNYEAALVREYEYYAQFKKIISRITKMDRVPNYIHILQFL